MAKLPNFSNYRQKLLNDTISAPLLNGMDMKSIDKDLQTEELELETRTLDYSEIIDQNFRFDGNTVVTNSNTCLSETNFQKRGFEHQTVASEEKLFSNTSVYDYSMSNMIGSHNDILGVPDSNDNNNNNDKEFYDNY